MFDKIYVVDDDEVSSFLTAVLLDTLHISQQTEVYLSAEEALEALAQQQASTLPDIIFLDLHMPVTNGWAFLDDLSVNVEKLGGKCRVYILSSSVDEAEIAKSKQYPMVVDFLHKPLEEEQLKKLLANQL